MRALILAAALAALTVPAIAPAVAEDSLPHAEMELLRRLRHL